MRAIFDSDRETVANCLAILESGMRRLGIDPEAPVSRLAVRTSSQGRPSEAERAQASAIERRGAYELSEHEVERIMELHAQGMTQLQIAQEIGCSQSTVARRLLERGIRKFRKRARAA